LASGRDVSLHGHEEPVESWLTGSADDLKTVFWKMKEDTAVLQMAFCIQGAFRIKKKKTLSMAYSSSFESNFYEYPTARCKKNPLETSRSNNRLL